MMYAFIMICFQRVESMQKQLDSSLKEVEGLKEARERQTQMVSAIMTYMYCRLCRSAG